MPSSQRSMGRLQSVFVLAGVMAVSVAGQSQASGDGLHASRHDRDRAKVLDARAADWRNGAVVYQVFVDRFAPPAGLDAKRSLYAPPRRLRDWADAPTPGKYLPDVGVWSHEIDFWGGDLTSLMGKLDYLEELGVDVLYLNPIHQAFTNHKYDAQDYFAVASEYGSREDVAALAAKLHERDMRLVLDGVFNHMGRTADWFQAALADEASPYRSWFFFGDEFKHGYRGWAHSANLPELRLEEVAVRQQIYGAADSVVQGYLREGVDGWRLDVAPELGFTHLSALTEAAHAARPGSLVVGENWVYPEEWSPALDAVMNFYYREAILALAEGKIGGPHAGRLFARMIEDTGLEPVLKSWIILDNHDIPRLKTVLPQPWQQHMAQVLQFTLPGSPCVYYGVEVGMDGGTDPLQRGPMRWDLVTEDNPDLVWMRRLLALRQNNRALRIGDFRLLDSERVLAFMRRTDCVGETTLVIVNPTDETATDLLPVRESKLLNGTTLHNVLGEGAVRMACGTIHVAIPPQTAWVLMPEIKTTGHDSYKRVQ